MQKRKGRVYVYANKNGTWRVEVRRATGERVTQTVQTESEAEALAHDTRKQFEGEEMPVSEAIDIYLLDMEKRELKARHVDTTGQRLRSMFVDGDLPLAELHKWTAQGLYDVLSSGKKSVDTHRNTLNQSRTFCKWLVKKGWLPTNPFADVEGVGRRKRRKAQLTIDESRKLSTWCLANESPGSTAALCCLLLGLRASEVAGLSARSVDDGGRIVRIEVAKTEAGIRMVEVPSVLRPRMLTMVAETFDRHWVGYHVRRCCQLAGVSVVGPHGLRGTHASLATSAGASSQLVASTLGHASIHVTEAHYTQPEALNGNRQATALKMLIGGAA